MERLERSLCLLENGLHYMGCAALLLVTVLLNLDIAMRLLLHTPLQMQFELIEFYLMPAIATLSLSYVFRHGAHLSLELIDLARFGRWQAPIRRLTLIFGAVFFALVTWKSGQMALSALIKGDVYFGVYDWPLGWAYLSIPVGCAILTLRLLLDTARGETTATVTP